MTLKDFAAKKRTEIQQEGVVHATKTGIKEAASKGLTPYAHYRSTPVWADEWDVCLVLDACRFDLWQEVIAETDYWLSESTQARWSVGSASVEWINETFADRYEDHWRETAYVTGNPHTGKPPAFGDCTDKSVYPLKNRGLPYLDEVWADQWNIDEYETVRPDVMTERALWAWQRRQQHSFDRLIVHYMQPHIPFKNHTGWSTGWKNTLAFGEDPMERNAKGDWQKLREGQIPEDEFWNAYASNLEWVLHEVDCWITETDATILITSDHGNAMGEWGIWGHPPESPCPVLRKVPWVLVEGVGDNQFNAEPRGEPPVIATADPDVEKRLEALGYR